jgi:RND family efflux transporter MFP subunit
MDAMTQLRFPRVLRLAVTACLLAGATATARPVWAYYMEAPWTRDGRVAADVVAVAPDVSGLISDVAVEDNQAVRRGAVLFHIDEARFRLALAQAQAVMDERAAAMAEAAREAARYGKLTDISVSEEKQQQRTSVATAAAAQYRQAVADRDVAALNLQRSAVRSPVDGTVTNFDLRPGDYATAGHTVLAVVDSSTLRVEGYFEETKLHAIHVGDPVTVRLMGDRDLLHGHVQSIAAGVVDRDRNTGSLLADINPTFTWVRLAQRIPVRVTLDRGTDKDALVVGRTATVSVKPLSEGVLF